jgi:AraC-like DNA-binding protein
MEHSIVGERRTYCDRAYTHEHDFAQLILPLKGTLMIETIVHQFELGCDRLFFLPPHCQHTFFARDSNEFLVLDIPQLFLTENGAQNPLGGLSLQSDDRWQAIRALILAELNQSTAQPDLLDLFRYAYRLLSKHWMPRSLHHIHAHYAQPIELQELAALEGYQQTYYCEWFKKLTGKTPKAYLQALRLAKAKELLAQTDLSIWQIAQQVGYEHHASFTRVFQQREQLSPASYRQQIRNLAN